MATVIASLCVIRRYGLIRALGVRLQVGFCALALLVLAEVLLNAAIQGRPLSQYVASRDPVSGSAYLAMLLLFALVPSILMRTRP